MVFIIQENNCTLSRPQATPAAGLRCAGCRVCWLAVHRDSAERLVLAAALSQSLLAFVLTPAMRFCVYSTDLFMKQL